MKKILGIAAALVLCAATASAGVGPPTGLPATDESATISATTGSGDHNPNVAGDINILFGNTAIFMGDEIGLLKGPCTVAGDIELWFFMNTGQDARLTTYRGADDVAIMLMNGGAKIDIFGIGVDNDLAGDIELWMRNVALSRGNETSQDEVGFIHNAASNESSFAYTGPNIGAMGVSDLANAGKMDGMAALLGANVAVLAHTSAWVTHGAPSTLCNTEVRGHNA